MTIVDIGGACLENAQSVERRPLAEAPHGAVESPMLCTRRVPGEAQRRSITLGWRRTTAGHLCGVRRHYEVCRRARPFTLTVPGDASSSTVIYAAPPRFVLRNSHWGELTVELVEIDSAEL